LRDTLWGGFFDKFSHYENQKKLDFLGIVLKCKFRNNAKILKKNRQSLETAQKKEKKLCSKHEKIGMCSY
jgi:hypothetical protein